MKRLSHTIARSDSPQRKRQCRSDVRNFDFNTQCLFCGDVCEPDTKHPNRHKRVILCKTADRPQRKSFKAAIVDKCHARGDQWSNEVLVRVEGAVIDLHAADARYHYDCKTKFVAPKVVRLATASVSGDQASIQGDPAYDKLVREMSAERSKIRNSSEIYQQYQMYGGMRMVKRTLMAAILAQFEEDLLVFTAAGIASILVFREKATGMFSLIPDDNDDDLDQAIKTVVKHVKRETAMIHHNKHEYQRRINIDLAEEYTSETMMNFLTKLCPNTTPKLPIVMICNMITTQLTKVPCPLQVTLGTLIRGKELVQQLNKFGVVCSYDEVLRFRKSAATASKQVGSRGLVHTSQTGAGLVQVVVDNFDANISSQNGLRSTHALAVLLTQTATCDTENSGLLPDTIPRIRKEDMPARPDMPQMKATKSVLSLTVLSSQAVAASRARARDYQFLSQIVGPNSCPEWNAFNSHLNRAEGHTIRPATTCVYTLLIGMKPSDPDTMPAAMVEAERLVKSTGQDIVVFTCDQQLYKVAVNITWANPERFQTFILRLGGMHFIMNLFGCVGTLMADTGLSDVMECAFGGVSHMLTGKRFPQNFRALRMVVEELLRSMILEADETNDVMSILQNRADKSQTSKLWVDMLIKPVLLIMMFCRAEKEADWLLHLYAVEHMTPYFFAARHPNYAHYGMYYLRSLAAMPTEILEKFMKGEHVTRHTRERHMD